jgi:hypothetical protein
MPLSAPVALAVSVVLSALGAVAVCLLVVLYGFTPASEMSARRAGRRQLVTGIGHAVAAFCFAATAILIALALLQPPRAAAPADTAVSALGAQLAKHESRLTGQESRLTGHDRRLGEQESRIKGHESRLLGQDSRLTQTETRLQAIDEAVRQASAREARGATEPPARRAATPPRQAVRPAAARTAPLPERPPAPDVVIVKPAPVVPPVAGTRPHDVEGSAFTTGPGLPLVTNEPSVAPGVSPSQPAVTPPTAPAVASPPPVVAPPPVVTPPGRGAATETASAPPARPAPAEPARPGFLGKLREDWATIKRSFEAGEEDFRRVREDTWRKLRGLVGE